MTWRARLDAPNSCRSGAAQRCLLVTAPLLLFAWMVHTVVNRAQPPETRLMAAGNASTAARLQTRVKYRGHSPVSTGSRPVTDGNNATMRQSAAADGPSSKASNASGPFLPGSNRAPTEPRNTPAATDTAAPLRQIMDARTLPGWVAPRDPAWMQYHQQLVLEVQAADTSKGFGITFYGDSITESWRGTVIGLPTHGLDFDGTPDVFETYFGAYNAAAFGIAGDEVGHLLWRLANGELPQQQHPKAVVVLIGTNDVLGQVATDPVLAQVIADRIITTLQFIQQRLPATAIMYLPILPKGFTWPNQVTEAIDTINHRVSSWMENQQKMQCIACSDIFLQDGHIKLDLMPDGLHPNAGGMEAIAQRIQPAIEGLVENP